MLGIISSVVCSGSTVFTGIFVHIVHRLLPFMYILTRLMFSGSSHRAGRFYPTSKFFNFKNERFGMSIISLAAMWLVLGVKSKAGKVIF